LGTASLTKPSGDVYFGVDDCEYQCAKTTGCVGFTYDRSNKNASVSPCKMYSQLTTTTSDNNYDLYVMPGQKTSAQLQLKSYTNTANTNLYSNSNIGSPLTNITNSKNDINSNGGYQGYTACEYNCDVNPTCVGFVLNSSSNSCLLYSNVNNAVTDNTNNTNYSVYAKSPLSKLSPISSTYSKTGNTGQANYDSALNSSTKISTISKSNLSNPNNNGGYTGVDACVLQCNNNSSCVGITYNKSDGTCDLRSKIYSGGNGDNNKDIYMKPGNSITPVTKKNYTTKANRDYTGGQPYNGNNDIGSNGASSIADCQTKCDLIANCNGFTYGGGTCYFKNIIPNSVAYNAPGNTAMVVNDRVGTDEAPEGTQAIFNGNNGTTSCDNFCKGWNTQGPSWPYAGKCVNVSINGIPARCDSTYSLNKGALQCNCQYNRSNGNWQPASWGGQHRDNVKVQFQSRWDGNRRLMNTTRNSGKNIFIAQNGTYDWWYDYYSGHLANDAGGNCLDTPEGNTSDYTQLGAYGCGDINNNNQVWRFGSDLKLYHIPSNTCVGNNGSGNWDAAVLYHDTRWCTPFNLNTFL